MVVELLTPHGTMGGGKGGGARRVEVYRFPRQPSSAPTIRKCHPQCFRLRGFRNTVRCLRCPIPDRNGERGVVGDVSSSVLVGRARQPRFRYNLEDKGNPRCTARQRLYAPPDPILSVHRADRVCPRSNPRGRECKGGKEGLLFRETLRTSAPLYEASRSIWARIRVSYVRIVSGCLYVGFGRR